MWRWNLVWMSLGARFEHQFPFFLPCEQYIPELRVQFHVPDFRRDVMGPLLLPLLLNADLTVTGLFAVSFSRNTLLANQAMCAAFSRVISHFSGCPAL